MSEPITYKSVGVDVDAKGAFVDAIAGHMRRTYGPRVIDRHGAFAGMLRLGSSPRFKRNWKDPVLVAGADGVGTKLLVAAAVNRFDTIGIDLVAMNVNDVLVMGAEPLFFLDYVAVPKIEKAKLVDIVKGIADGCEKAGCALLGGETAEMPALYRPGEFDLAGFSVGVVERKRIVTGDAVKAGDAIIGLASDGLHSNGYSLARKLVFEVGGFKPTDRVEELGKSAGDELLTPTRIYCKPVVALLRKFQRKKHGRPVHGMAHITGEAFPGNIPRSVPAGLMAAVDAKSWPRPAIFGMLQRLGKLPDAEMFGTFNMGIGFVLVVAPDFADKAVAFLNDAGERAYRIGEIRERPDGAPEVEIA
jgi:phosphoribosylformylglycinamidine cyclo-ligase